MPNNQSAETTPLPDNQALEERVETIMGIKTPEVSSPLPQPIAPTPIPVKPQSPPTNITKVTAQSSEVKPDISDTLLNQIGAVPAETIASIAPSEPSLDDAVSDKAIDDISSSELDEASDSESNIENDSDDTTEGWTDKLGRLLKNKWLWVSVIVVLIGALSFSPIRYKLLGLVFKASISVSVIDSQTNTPVSDAIIKLGGETTKTNGSGNATINVPVGQGTIMVSKSYYKTYSRPHFTGFKSNKAVNVRLVATGHQVSITVLNRITDKPLAGAEIALLNTTAKTNQQGQADVVLPATAQSGTANVSLNGYNAATLNITVTNALSSTNAVSLTPSGHIYFLSDSNGTIDVVKSNLDGSDRQIILAGTGNENPNTTSLLASRDWRYLVLKAQRENAQSSLYLIDTSDDKVTEFDDSNANFTLVGWYGHNFVYDMVYNTVPDSQNAHEVLKSYDADTQQLNLLDQNLAEGNATDFAYQSFSDFYIINGQVIYDTMWNTSNATGSGIDPSSLSDTIRGVELNGQGKKDYQTVAASSVSSIQAVLYAPQAVYYAFYNASTSSAAYYQFSNQAVTLLDNFNQSTFNEQYPSYLFSPSSNQTLWNVVLEGQNNLFIGDENAQKQKQIGGLSDYLPYGWYSDNYVLLSQNNDELYIIPTSGLAANEQPLKITDYYQVPQTYTSSEYSYGGL